MDLKEQYLKTGDFFIECHKIIEQKGKDYNPSGVAFDKLKEEAEILGMSPEKMLMVYMSKHYAAIQTYVQKGQVETEPIRERLKDMANYCALMAVLIEEKK